MSDVITFNGNEINLIKVGINNQLNAKQKALLKTMYDCLQNNRPFNWDLMVVFYSNNVKKMYEKYEYEYDWDSPSLKKTNQRYISYNITVEYAKNTSLWSYYIKPSIRQWFCTNIGSMVLKGSVLALPVIELE